MDSLGANRFSNDLFGTVALDGVSLALSTAESEDFDDDMPEVKVDIAGRLSL